jgi:hypothetical protein
MSMKIALEQLGLKPGHHMVDMDQPAFWRCHADGERVEGPKDFDLL